MSSPLTKTYINARGSTCVQIFQQYPSLLPFYTSYEVNYDVNPVHLWFKRTWYWLPVLLSVVYVGVVYFFKKRKNDGGNYKVALSSVGKRRLNVALITWNTTLSIFSLLGSIRTTPHLLHIVLNHPLSEQLCRPAHQAWGSFSTGMWVQLFIMSKPVELVDTFFLIVRGKDVIFLHWYHHVSVLLFCWHSYAEESSTGLFFCTINYTVHGVMYAYYAMQAGRCKPRFFKPIYVVSVFVCFVFVCVFFFVV